MIEIVSFGGGVQSTAIAQMVLNGDLPRPDLWLFADTGDEPEQVYAHVDKWRAKIEEAGMLFEVVYRTDPFESLSDHVLNKIKKGEGSVNYPPLYVNREQTAGRMPIFRGCTYAYKVKPLDKRSRQFAEVPRGYKGAPLVRKWLGISFDEIGRSKSSTVPWFEFWYPLIEQRIRRSDCLQYLKKHGESAPRSACVYCPFHSDKEWRRIKEEGGADWEKAVKFERDFHAVWKEQGGFGGLRSRPTLHKTGQPIDEIDFEDRQEQLWDTWDQECAGVCGV